MIKQYREVTAFIDNKKVFLSNNELYCLRLMLHEHSIFEIADFLETDISNVFVIRDSVIRKLNSETWYSTIIKAFQYNFLSRYDFVNPIVKQEAILFSHLLIEKIFGATNASKSVNYLRDAVTEFFNTCQAKLLAENKEHFSLNEKRYLELKFKGLTNDFIDKELKLKKGKTETISKDLFAKLQVNELFNSFKKAFHLELIPKDEDFVIYTEVEAIETASRIASLTSYTKNTIKEKELIIYHELIGYYTKVEFKFLRQAKL
jgi:DNA-binding CsgD family transcriptional regulator